MNKEITLTKLEAAKRQLETAITLYFNDADPVSIHTLVSASHEILAALNKEAGNTPTIISDSLINEGYKKEFRKWMKEPRNFFKHADKDPKGAYTFYPEINDFFLLDACETYQVLTGEKVPHFIIFRGWFNAQHPHIMKMERGAEMLRDFGNNKLKFFSSLLAVSAVIRRS
jgi:hypothetical protein